MLQLDVIRGKILEGRGLQSQLAHWRLKGGRIVFTNGCFDLIHLGHIDYLSRSKDLGDRLVVGINTDASVRLLNKGNSRPIKDEISRAMIIASLHFVDAAVLFGENTPIGLIQEIKPEVLVKGADYDKNETDPNSPKYIVGSREVRENGGEVQTIPFLDGYSTTAIENKIKTELG